MKLLVIDDEKKWRAHWTGQGVSAVATLAEARPIIATGGVDTVLLAAQRMNLIPELIRLGVKIIVATAQPLTAEAIAAYRAGGHSHAVLDYVVKDFRMTKGKLARRVKPAKAKTTNER